MRCTPVRYEPPRKSFSRSTILHRALLTGYRPSAKSHQRQGPPQEAQGGKLPAAKEERLSKLLGAVSALYVLHELLEIRACAQC